MTEKRHELQPVANVITIPCKRYVAENLLDVLFLSVAVTRDSANQHAYSSITVHF
jgi:hypothetical protein